VIRRSAVANLRKSSKTKVELFGDVCWHIRHKLHSGLSVVVDQHETDTTVSSYSTQLPATPLWCYCTLSLKSNLVHYIIHMKSHGNNF